jgi:transcriptional accessory protein Tex/SPT6
MELARYYFEIGNKSTLDIWNFYRKRIITGFLNDFFLPHLLSEVKEELTKEGEKEIINACVNKLRQQLNKGPSLK